MAGPGGGSRGGGGGRGGGRGGRFGGGRGGGYGGGHYGGHYGYNRYYFFSPWRASYFYSRSLFSLIMAPIFMILFAGMFLFVAGFSAISSIINGGNVVYDEQKFQDYTNEAYIEEFGEYDGYEDNILIVFLTYEDNSQYNYIAWVGDNIRNDVNYMFGGDYSDLGYAISSNVNSANYSYSLSKNLSMAIDTMENHVTVEIGTGSAFINEEAAAKRPTSKLVNLSPLAMSDTVLNASLEEFTENTGIPIVVRVDSAENVFGKTISIFSFIIAGVALFLIIYSIYTIIRTIREKKKGPKNGGNIVDDPDTGSRDNNIFD